MRIPEDRFYTENHLWVKRLRGDKALIGLTEPGQLQLGEILDLELPEEGDELEKDEAFGSVESSQGVVDLISPVTGEVIAINEELLDTPEIINEDPYDEGWIIKVKLEDPDELDELLPPDDYEEIAAEIDIPVEENEFDFEEEE